MLQRRGRNPWHPRSKYHSAGRGGRNADRDCAPEEPETGDQHAAFTVSPDESLLVVSFDGAARIKNKGGAYSAVIWKLPEWTIVSAASPFNTGLTVNEAEYHGLLLSCELLHRQTRGRVVICGDSNSAIRQMRGEIDCKAPGLQLLRLKALHQLRSWPTREFLHAKRDWNQSADSLASSAL